MATLSLITKENPAKVERQMTFLSWRWLKCETLTNPSLEQLETPPHVWPLLDRAQVVSGGLGLKMSQPTSKL